MAHTAGDFPLDRVLAQCGPTAVRHARRGGGYRVARCPACGDDEKLSIHEHNSGRVDLLCDAGCSKLAILAALGLTAGDLAVPSRATREAGEESAERRPTRILLDDVDEELSREPPMVVPYLLARGRTTLIAMREKFGKTTLAAAAAASTSIGGLFFGRQSALGDVVIFALEEHLGDAARRLRRFGADGQRVHLVPALHAEPKDRVSELRKHLDAVKPVSAWVDTLYAFSHGSIRDWSRPDQIGGIVQDLTRVAHEADVALGILHHATKATQEYRDSTAIGASVDLILEISAPDPKTEPAADPSIRRARARGRMIGEDFTYRYDGVSLELVNGAAPRPIDDRIADFVQNKPGASVRDVAAAIRGVSTKATTDAIDTMLAAGRLVDTGTQRQRRLALAPIPALEPVNGNGGQS